MASASSLTLAFAVGSVMQTACFLSIVILIASESSGESTSNATARVVRISSLTSPSLLLLLLLLPHPLLIPCTLAC